MSAHTPGVWVARPDPHGAPSDYCIGLDDDCTPVDYVAVCHKRDARLIAAAPDMLAMLRICHEWLQGSAPHRACAVGDVIAKATQP